MIAAGMGFNKHFALNAITDGHLSVVKSVIAAGYKFGREDFIAVAIRHGHIEISRFLIKAGANVNTSDDKGQSPLILAAMYGHIEIVKLLLESGANVDYRNRYGHTALMCAVCRYRITIAKLLIDAKSDITDVLLKAWKRDSNLVPYITERYGGEEFRHIIKLNANRALHYAVITSKLPLVKKALKAGADVSWKEKFGFTALWYAITNKEIVEAIIQHDPLFVDKEAFYRAIEKGNLEIVEILLKQGVYVNEYTTALKKTTRVDMYRLLVKYGADIGVLDMFEIIVDVLPHIPYEICPNDIFRTRRAYCIETVKILIDLGANVNSTNSDGMTPLMAVAMKGLPDLVEPLIKRGAQVNAVNRLGGTALGIAIDYRHAHTAKLLIDAGAK